jgi:opacity protein-like surface antigen
MKSVSVAVVFAVAALASGTAPAAAQTPGFDANGCGWYIVLGCSKSRSDAKRQLIDLGGPWSAAAPVRG